MHNLLIEADYVGSKGTHILTLGDLNQFVHNGQQVLLNAQGQPTLPYPGFGLLEYSQNNGNSSYNGLDLTLQRRFAAGLSFQLAYTWSKSIDNTAEQLSVYGSNSVFTDRQQHARLAWAERLRRPAARGVQLGL